MSFDEDDFVIVGGRAMPRSVIYAQRLQGLGWNPEQAASMSDAEIANAINHNLGPHQMKLEVGKDLSQVMAGHNTFIPPKPSMPQRQMRMETPAGSMITHGAGNPPPPKPVTLKENSAGWTAPLSEDFSEGEYQQPQQPQFQQPRIQPQQPQLQQPQFQQPQPQYQPQSIPHTVSEPTITWAKLRSILDAAVQLSATDVGIVSAKMLIEGQGCQMALAAYNEEAFKKMYPEGLPVQDSPQTKVQGHKIIMVEIKANAVHIVTTNGVLTISAVNPHLTLQ